MDALGHAELRHGAAATGDGHRPRSSAVAVSRGESGERLQGQLVHHGVTETQRRSEALDNKQALMLTQDQAAEIFDRIKKISSADEVEVLFSGGKFALTRFANNIIHQNIAEENHTVSVRTVFAGRTARASTNKFD